MPVVHGYVNQAGHYIKANQGGSMVTYQVTSDGEKYLRKRGKGDGSRVSPREVKKMRRRGWIYTRESGPGDVDPWGARRGSSGSGCCCCAVTLGIGFGGVAMLSGVLLFFVGRTE